MPEIDILLRRWRARTAARTGLSAATLDELEDHLRCAVDEELVRGLPPARAVARARARLGDPLRIARELEPGTSLMQLSRILGMVASAALVFVALDAAGTFDSLVEPGRLLFVAGLLASGLWASFGPRAVVSAIAATLGGRPPRNEADRSLRLAVLARAYQLSWASGILVGLIGVLVTLSALGEPEELWQSLAFAGLALLYGALLAELLFANLRSWAARPGVPGG